MCAFVEPLVLPYVAAYVLYGLKMSNQITKNTSDFEIR